MVKTCDGRKEGGSTGERLNTGGGGAKSVLLLRSVVISDTFTLFTWLAYRC